MNAKEVNEFLTSHSFNPSKKMGQNFLINDNVPNEIVNNIDFNGVDCVVEIGPGLGALTDKLIEKHDNIIAIELDKRLYSFLQKKFKGNDSLTLINEDVLHVDFDKLVGQYKKTIIVSNLPYSISSLVVVKFIKDKNIRTMYCMLQKEMAEKLTARPSTKPYNSFSALTNYYCQVKNILKVGQNNFIPAPEVDSIVIKIDKRLPEEFDPKFDTFLRVAFASKRKTLMNNLKNSYGSDVLIKSLTSHGIDQKIRAEAIDTQTLRKIFLEINHE